MAAPADAPPAQPQRCSKGAAQFTSLSGAFAACVSTDVYYSNPKWLNYFWRALGESCSLGIPVLQAFRRHWGLFLLFIHRRGETHTQNLSISHKRKDGALSAIVLKSRKHPGKRKILSESHLLLRNCGFSFSYTTADWSKEMSTRGKVTMEWCPPELDTWRCSVASVLPCPRKRHVVDMAVQAHPRAQTQAGCAQHKGSDASDSPAAGSSSGHSWTPWAQQPGGTKPTPIGARPRNRAAWLSCTCVLLQMFNCYSSKEQRQK